MKPRRQRTIAPALQAPDRARRRRSLGIALLFLVALTGCRADESVEESDSRDFDLHSETDARVETPGPSSEAAPAVPLPAGLTSRQKVQRVCGQCHLVPDPEHLDRASWERSVLPMMGWRLGIYEPEVPRHEILAGAVDRERVLRENRFPEQPRLAEEDWQEIRQWYLDRAPEQLTADRSKQEALGERDLLMNPDHELHWADPLPRAVTLVEIDTERSLIYLGGVDRGESALWVLDHSWTPLQRIPLPSPPVEMTADGSNRIVTLIGTLRLRESGNRPGELVRLVRPDGEPLFTGLQGFAGELNRPVQTLRMDLTGDGMDDLVVAEFGFYTGSITLFERTGRSDRAGGSPYERRELYREPGAVRLASADLNGDGEEELLALIGQGDEGVMRFVPDKEGTLHAEWLLRFHPGWGSTDLITADLTGNGRTDLVVCNGDNGDFPPVLRNDHGVRIYENRGDMEFVEVAWHPLDGAYRCRLAGPDRRELVAISYFPDEERSPRGDLIYLKVRQEGEMEVREWPVDLPARWLALDVAPLAPGEPPVVLVGSHGELPTSEPFTETQLRRRLSVLEWRPDMEQ